MKLFKNKDWLYNEFITIDKSVKHIAENQNVTSKTIYDWLIKFGIPRKRILKPATKVSFKLFSSLIGKENYHFVSKEYINSSTKMNVICPKGHCTEITWNSWSEGNRCRYCINNNVKYEYKYVEEQFKKEGYQLLTKEYKGNKQKLEYICPEGHHRFITFDSWVQGHRCWECTNAYKNKYEDIKKEFKKRRYTLLSKEYKNAFQKLEYICPKGHKGTIRWSNFNQGAECFQCSVENRFKDWTKQQINDFEDYRIAITHQTNKNYYKYKQIINPLNKNRSLTEYHVDHIYSVVSGFLNNISIEIISNPYNLQMLTAFDNRSKNKRSDISIDELYTLYWKFLRNKRK